MALRIRILLVVYDHAMLHNWFPMSLGYIASSARNAGASVDVWCQDIHHYSDYELTRLLTKNHYDIIGINAIGGYWEYKKLKSLCQAVKASGTKATLIVGGHLCAPDPAYFIERFGIDIVCLGEGEGVITDLVQGKDWKSISGIAFDGGNTGKRKLIKDLDTIPMPAYDLFPIEIYRLQRFAHINKTDFCLPMLSGRGCTFTCNFCYRLDKGYRKRSNEAIIDEVKYLQKKYRINYIYFFDELLMTSEKKTIELCEAFLKAGLKFNWSCMGRLNYATPRVLDTMKRAGCVFINYGIESVDDKVLTLMNKHLTYDQIIKGVEATYKAGISPGLNIIWGNLGDTPETLYKSVEFLQKYDDHTQLRTIRPVTPYPGSPLYNEAIKMGLLNGVEDFYENKHKNSDLLTVNFTDLTDHEFYRCLYEANNILLSEYQNHTKTAIHYQLNSLYVKNDATFRGFRQT